MIRSAAKQLLCVKVTESDAPQMSAANSPKRGQKAKDAFDCRLRDGSLPPKGFKEREGQLRFVEHGHESPAPAFPEWARHHPTLPPRQPRHDGLATDVEAGFQLLDAVRRESLLACRHQDDDDRDVRLAPKKADGLRRQALPTAVPAAAETKTAPALVGGAGRQAVTNAPEISPVKLAVAFGAQTAVCLGGDRLVNLQEKCEKVRIGHEVVVMQRILQSLRNRRFKPRRSEIKLIEGAFFQTLE